MPAAVIGRGRSVLQRFLPRAPLTFHVVPADSTDDRPTERRTAMTKILILLGALAAVTVLRPLLMLAIARVFGRAIGAEALSRQPDTIQLERASNERWAQPARSAAAAQALNAAGFSDAGTYTV